ncbi:hypothetical protein EXS73_03415 [Candidatus Pacearchaeota archaeon]|nr:hypothetical protein [Candidatus Pacearchaeota archaeon]
MRFLRSDTNRHKRLGSHRPKLQKWRRPRGRHNKIRRKRFGYPLRVEIGYSSPRATAGLVDGKIPLVVKNIQDLAQATSKNMVVFARTLGAKKRADFMKIVEERKLSLWTSARGAQ